MEDVQAALARLGAPAELAPQAVAALGPGAAAELDADPWRLLALPRVTVAQADYCARRLLGEGARPDDPRRGQSFTARVLSLAARHGHTALEERRLAAEVGRLGFPAPAAALAAAVESGLAAVFESVEEPEEDFDFTGGEVPEVPEPDRHYALPRIGRAEQHLGEGLARLTGASEPVMDPATAAETVEAAAARWGFAPAEATRAAVVTAALRGVAVLGHGAGGGRALAQALACLAAIAADSGVGIAVAAPTSQAAAAVNAGLAELYGPGEPQVAAVALERLLEGGAAGRGLVVVCEAMALDVERAAALVRVCEDGAHLVLAADPLQAPSAGPGQVVADLVASRTAAVAVLEEEAGPGPLVRTAQLVGEGELAPQEGPDREVVRVPASSAEEAAHRALQLLTDSIPRALGIGVEQVQLVTAGTGGAAGAAALNTACKERLNPGPGAHGGLDPGDRVRVAATGDVGYLRASADGLAVELADGTRTAVADPAGLRPAWAVTVADAHGGRWPAVVAVFPPDTRGSRPQVYTALTRARRHVSIVDAAGPALAEAVREKAALPRMTRLVRVLREG